MRRRLVALVLLASAAWLACWCATVVPGTGAVTLQWALGNALAALAGMALGAAFSRPAC